MRRIWLTCIGLLVATALLLADSTGNTFVTVGENTDRAGLTAWTNPGNIVSDNTTNATCTGAGSDYLGGRTLGFSLAVGAVVGGVLVRIEALENAGGTEALLAQLQDDNGALVGASKSTSNEGNLSGASMAVYTYGSTTDVWGATLTRTIVNDADFGVRFWFATSHTVEVDYVTVSVTYSIPPDALPFNGPIRGGGVSFTETRRAR